MRQHIWNWHTLECRHCGAAAVIPAGRCPGPKESEVANENEYSTDALKRRVLDTLLAVMESPASDPVARMEAASRVEYLIHARENADTKSVAWTTASILEVG